MKSETETLSAFRSENESIITSNHEAHEENHEKTVSTSPSSSLESTQKALSGEMLSPLQKDVEQLQMVESHLHSCQNWANWEHVEVDTICELSDPGDPVHFVDTATAATSRGTATESVGENHVHSCQNWADWEHVEGDTPCELSDPGDPVHLADTATAATLRVTATEIVGENSELHLRFRTTPNGFEYEDWLTKSSERNCNPALKTELKRPLDNSSYCLTASNTGNSLDSNETVVSPKANEGFARENLFDPATEALGSHSSMGTCGALHFADFSGQQSAIQEISKAVVVSTDLNGWQRFDAEQHEANGVAGFQQTIAGTSQNRLELWEQLLEDGSEGCAQCTPMTTAPVEAEVGIESAIHDGNQFWLASPGNPFVEGLPRPSNFSEADGFVTDVNFIGSQALHDYGVEAAIGEEHIQTDDIGEEIYPGITKENSVEASMGNRFNDMHSDGSKKTAQQRFPSFSDILRSSSRPRNSSFLNFKEPEPAYDGHGYEAGGEKWEANFDLVSPAIHEGPRSLSLPREAGKSQRQGSFGVQLTSQSKLSSFLSPKLSPIVKKVASKVRTNSDQGKNAFHQGKGSKAVGKEQSRRWTWNSCICCSHGS